MSTSEQANLMRYGRGRHGILYCLRNPGLCVCVSRAMAKLVLMPLCVKVFPYLLAEGKHHCHADGGVAVD